MASFEILEHTADIGLRAEGATLEELFAQATRGLASIIGIWQPRNLGEDMGEDIGEAVRLDVTAEDLGGLLVDWLSEALYLHDARVAAFAEVRVDAIRDGRAIGELRILPFDAGQIEGLQVKAITYHDLSVEQVHGRWVATVYFDI